jgi:hypothetical protein
MIIYFFSKKLLQTSAEVSLFCFSAIDHPLKGTSVFPGTACKSATAHLLSKEAVPTPVLP